MTTSLKTTATALVMFLAAMQAMGATRASEVLLVVDSSASMSESTSDGTRRIDAAKGAFEAIVPHLQDQQVGLLLFGHRVEANQPGCCQDLELSIPIGPFSESAFTSAVHSLTPRGNTPLALSLTTARDLLVSRDKDVSKAIIVLTDGNETCHGDPQSIAAEMAKMGIKIKVHVVGFAVKPEEEKQLRSIAKEGNGMYVEAKDAASLKKVLTEVVVLASTEAAPKRPSAPYFLDEFDQNELAAHWDVLNPDEDSFIVEEGKLLFVSHDHADVVEGSIPNLFLLNHPLPEGDWTMTANVRFNVQTKREAIVFGLYEDPKNFTMVKTWLYTSWAVEGTQYHSSNKASNGKVASNHSEIWTAESAHPGQMLLRVQKRGRSYQMATKFADDNNPERKFDWVDAGTVTNIRARGRLAIGAYQWEKVPGESTFEIDWVRIDSDN